MKLMFNGSLRVLSIAPKLYLSFYLLKAWTLADIGKFNLLSSSITILVLVIGVDFYNYSNREYIKAQNQAIKSKILIKQLFFYIFVYLFSLPIFHFLLLKYYPLGRIEIYFFIILVCEHLSQEIYRILNISESQIIASILLILRNGLWIGIFFTSIVFQNKTTEGLENLLKSWSIGAVMCTIFSFWVIQKKIHISTSNFNFINFFLFYKKSIGIIGIYFIITLLYKFLEYSGRYIIAFYFESKTLGIYSIFYQISNLITLLFDSTIIAFMYPKLLKYFNENDPNSFNKEITNSIKKMLFYGFLFIIIFYSFRKFAYIFINKPELENYDMLLILILSNNLLYSLSFIYHYALYSMRDDKGIFQAVVISFILNIFTLPFIHYFDIYGVALGGCLSYIGLFSFKYIIYKRNNTKFVKKNGESI